VESPSPSDFFALLGLESRYAIDRELLERNYLEAAKRWHPDRFAGASSAEQRVALERSGALNEGYRVLRDPIRRAEYLVKLSGIDLDSSDERGGAPKPSQAFLMAMIERREQLEDCRLEGANSLEALLDEVAEEESDALQGAITALAARDVRGAAEALVVHRYLQRLHEEIDDALESGQ
jgi:molecular chaperone HscB